MLRRAALALVSPVVAVVCVVLFGTVLILAVGGSPAEVAGEAVSSTLFTGYGFGEVLFKATPLILTGLAAAIPLAAGLFNIGAEGQVLLGGLACAALAHVLAPLGVVGMVISIVGAAVAGALGAAVAGWLRHARQVSEVLSTIMLNFIYTALAGWLLHAFLAQPGTSHTPELAEPLLFTRFSALFDGMQGSLVSTSLILAVIMAVLSQWLLFRSVPGFELRVTGSSHHAAQHAGISAARMTIGAMAVGGAMAGLAGAHFVLGARRFFEEGMSAGEGFLGIAVALMAHGHPWAVIPSAALFAGLSQAGLSMGAVVPRELVLVLQGLVVLALGATGAFLQRVPVRKLEATHPSEVQRA